VFNGIVAGVLCLNTLFDFETHRDSQLFCSSSFFFPLLAFFFSDPDDRRFSSNAKIAEMSEMFSAHPRESMVAALQLANGDTEKATELMLSEELFSHNREDDNNVALSQMIAASITELGPKVVELRDAVHAIGTFQELKAKVSLGKAVADIKRALAEFPATSKRPKPAELPAGAEGTTQAQLIRFKNTIALSVWEILRKLDGIGTRINSTTLPTDRLEQIGAAIKSIREILETVEVEAPIASPSVPRRGPKSDEEFYIDVSEIDMGQEIGKGAYGKVYKGKFRGRVVAIKTIAVKDDKELVLIRREISLLRECDHGNIVELIGVSKKDEELLLVTEFVDRGELYKVLLDESIEIDWPLRLKIAQDVASGLAHVHSKNLIHRDIKSENLLVNSNWEVKLCDFGFARAVSHGLHRYTICVPEEHEILTDRGFVDLDTYKALAERDATLRVASFDPKAQRLVFERPLRLVENERAVQPMVEFSSAYEIAGADAWTEAGASRRSVGDAAHASNQLSVLVTPQHHMYAQYGTAQPDAAAVVAFRRDKRRAQQAAPYELLEAGELLKLGADVAVRQLAAADAGQRGSMTLPAPLAEALQLSTPAKQALFLAVYGYWLCESGGALRKDAVLFFAPGGTAARVWLCESLVQLGATEFACDDAPACAIALRDARWLSVFAAEYGHSTSLGVAATGAPAPLPPTVTEADLGGAAGAALFAKLKALTALPTDCAPLAAPAVRVSADVVIESASGGAFDAVSSAAGSRLAPESGTGAKWVANWVWSLDATLLRRLLDGAVRADGARPQQQLLHQHQLWTTSARFRDELVRLCLLAGYTAHFCAGDCAGRWLVSFASAASNADSATPTLYAARGDIRARQYDGRTWCFTMPSGFVWVRRAVKNSDGVVVKASRAVLTGNCGSMYFNAPELLLGKPYDQKADVFAYGIFLCELITRGGINLVRRKETAFGLDVKALEEHIPKECPPLFWKVAFCCCTYNPQRRPSMDQVSKMLTKIRAKFPINRQLKL
jgi:serine/threonine protein kinase